MATRFLLAVSVVVFLIESSVATMFSARLIHRFSDEVKAFRAAKSGGLSVAWPERKTMEYYKLLVKSDLERQKVMLGSKYQFLFPSEGSNAMSFGNDYGWLHYTWIDIGTPNVSFLVALDAGSDLLWVPCECIQCAPLSANYVGLDRDLNEYSPSGSSTSKNLSCSHQLCESSPGCGSPKQPCPYTINYYSENTSSSGLLIEDILHLTRGSNDKYKSSVQAPVIIGCGMRQTGGYLDGVAPDGLMGLGFGEISVPSFLAKAGLVRNSFSLCFNDDDSGSIFFGDQGLATQQSTLFLPSDGEYKTYIVGVEACCIGSSCIKQTSFRALVDSGTSFTFLPDESYRNIVDEFDRQVNSTRFSFGGYPWEYCYKSSSKELLKNPSVILKFAHNSSFVVHNPFFPVYGYQGVVGFCLAIQPIDGGIGILGQNFMTGYRMVFDRENRKLGWSRSNCQDLTDGERMPLTPPKGGAPNPLPTNEQQSTPSGHTVTPAVAGRAPSNPSTASKKLKLSQFHWVTLLPLVLLLLHLLPSTS